MRRFKTQEEIDQERRAARTLGQTVMPTNRGLIVYARQSTKDQALNNKESTEQQTTDLLALGLDYGWSQEDTTLYIENRFTKDGKVTDEIRNASGTLRIDQRPGLNAVKQRIESGEVGAILVWDVSRLFRDEDMIEPAIFAKACKAKKALILTNDDQFDFTNTRRDDRKRFLDEAQAAADFITKHIRKMNMARDKKAGRGEWPGGLLPVGFTLDKDRKHLVPYPPHAEKVAYLFKRFRELGGVLSQLAKEVYQSPIFPDVPGSPPLQQLKRVPGGHTFITRHGLKYLLCNPVYAGHACYKGQIIKKNAHPAIVDEQDFFFAFNLLSDTDFDGMPIERPKQAVRYQQKNSLPNTALLRGLRLDGTPMIATGVGGVYVGAQSNKKLSYKIINSRARLGPSSEYAIASLYVDDLDKVVSDRVLYWLEQYKKLHDGLASPLIDAVATVVPTGDPQNPHQFITVVKSPAQYDYDPEIGIMARKVAIETESMPLEPTIYEQFQGIAKEGSIKVTNIDKTIAEYRQGIADLDKDYRINFGIESEEYLRRNRIKKKKLENSIEEIKKKHEQEEKARQELEEGRGLLCDAPEQWHKWALEKKQRLIRLATQSITLDQISEGWFSLKIEWSPYLGFNFVDTAYIWREKSGMRWTEEESQVLRDHYPTALRSWLQERLPYRTWPSIRVQAGDLNVHRLRIPTDINLPDYMSINDRRILDTYGLPLDEPGKRVWWHCVSSANGNNSSM